MNEQENEQSLKARIIVIAVAVVAYCLLYLITIAGVLMVVAATAASVYYGFKWGREIATDSEMWENRRIAKHGRLENARQREAEYFRLQGQDWLQQHVDNYYDDRQRNLYPKDKNRFDDTLSAVRKIKDAIK